LLGEDAMPAKEIVLGKMPVVLDLLAQVLRQIGAQPRAHLVAKRGLLGREVEIHGGAKSLT